MAVYGWLRIVLVLNCKLASVRHNNTSRLGLFAMNSGEYPHPLHSFIKCLRDTEEESLRGSLPRSVYHNSITILRRKGHWPFNAICINYTANWLILK